MPLEENNSWIQRYTALQIKAQNSDMPRGPLNPFALQLKLEGLAEMMFAWSTPNLTIRTLRLKHYSI